MIAPVSRSVLIVDDDGVFRRLASRMLTASGLVIVGEALTVAAGLDAARDLRPDAALVDVNLPDGDGVSLARALSELPAPPVVVLCSTDPDAASPDEVRDAGATAFVAKDELPNAPLRSLLGWAEE